MKYSDLIWRWIFQVNEDLNSEISSTPANIEGPGRILYANLQLLKIVTTGEL